jgi:hypothetical protein
LSGNNLQGQISDALGELSQLRLLRLGDNDLEGTFPDNLFNLSLLRVFSVKNNQLEGAIPEDFGNLTLLDTLNLSGNILGGTIPQKLSEIPTLKSLDLSGNNLRGEIPADLGELGQLLQFNVADNDLRGDLPITIANISTLNRLDISGNEIENLPDLSSITTLDSIFVQLNRLQFDDIEQNLSVSGIIYSPQDSIVIPNDTLVNQLSELVLGVDVGGTDLEYQWFKDGDELMGETGPTLTLPMVNFPDEGFYFVEVNSPVVTDLTLFSNNVDVRVSSLERDSLALRRIYNQTGGPNWVRRNNWLTGPLSTWQGVVIRDRRVAEVNLQNNNRFGDMPRRLRDIGNLD